VRSKCRPEIGDNIMFVSVSLVEPSKAAVFAYDGAWRHCAARAAERPRIDTLAGIDLGDGVDQHVDLGERSAFVILLDLSRNKVRVRAPARLAAPRAACDVPLSPSPTRTPTRTQTWEVVVAIAEGKIVSLTHVPGVQPALAPGEYEECASIVKSDPRFLAMCKERKLDPNMVVVEAWSAGNMTPDDDPARRIIRPLLYVKSRDHLHSNPYSRCARARALALTRARARARALALAAAR
jgi:Cu2+-containing amine oxidase